MEGALKVIRAHGSKISPAKHETVSLLGSFHGRTLGALSLTSSKKAQRLGFMRQALDVVHVPYPNTFRHFANDLPTDEKTISRDSNLRPKRNYFLKLVQSILSQQVSTKAAASMYLKLSKQFPREKVTPAALTASAVFINCFSLSTEHGPAMT